MLPKLNLNPENSPKPWTPRTRRADVPPRRFGVRFGVRRTRRWGRCGRSWCRRSRPRPTTGRSRPSSPRPGAGRAPASRAWPGAGHLPKKERKTRPGHQFLTEASTRHCKQKQKSGDLSKWRECGSHGCHSHGSRMVANTWMREMILEGTFVHFPECGSWELVHWFV